MPQYVIYAKTFIQSREESIIRFTTLLVFVPRGYSYFYTPFISTQCHKLSAVLQSPWRCNVSHMRSGLCSVTERCALCHIVNVVSIQAPDPTKSQWTQTVNRAFGACSDRLGQVLQFTRYIYRFGHSSCMMPICNMCWYIMLQTRLGLSFAICALYLVASATFLMSTIIKSLCSANINQYCRGQF